MRALAAPSLAPTEGARPIRSARPKHSSARLELAIGDAHPTLRDGYIEIGRPSSAEAITFDPVTSRNPLTGGSVSRADTPCSRQRPGV